MDSPEKTDIKAWKPCKNRYCDADSLVQRFNTSNAHDFLFHARVECYGLKIHSIWKTFLSHPILWDWLCSFFCIPTGEREFWNRLPISLANIQTCLHLQKQFDISIYINHIYIYAYNMLLACTIYRFVPSKLATICRFSYQKQKTKSTVLIFRVGGIGKGGAHMTKAPPPSSTTGGQRSL